jgi:hypothetical protein
MSTTLSRGRPLGGLGLVVGGVVVLLLAGMATTPRPKTMAALPDAIVAQEAEDTTDAAGAQIGAPLDLEFDTPFDGIGVKGAALALPVGVGKEAPVELNPRHYGKHNAGTLPANTILTYVRLCMEEHHRGGNDPRDPQGRKLKLTIYYSAMRQGFLAVVEVIGSELCGGVVYSPFEDIFATRTVYGGSECQVPSCIYWAEQRAKGYYRQVIFTIGG